MFFTFLIIAHPQKMSRGLYIIPEKNFCVVKWVISFDNADPRKKTAKKLFRKFYFFEEKYGMIGGNRCIRKR